MVGALLGALGTVIVFSPNISFWDNWYNHKLSFYQAALTGLHTLSTFAPELSEEDGRQREKTLHVKEDGFNEILELLKEINAERVSDIINIEQITNRRVTKYEEKSREYIDIMNVIHVYNSKAKFPYSLITTETDLRQHLRDRRNRAIEGWGTFFVILGIFWGYLWQGSVYTKNEFLNFLSRRKKIMTYIVLANFTDQGISGIKDTGKRAKAFHDMAKQMGVVIKNIFWTMGHYDIVVMMEASKDENVAALMMKVGSLGNMKSQTLRAFTETEIGSLTTQL